ncbi:MAG: 4Fe-4S binding protein [Pelotomaculum sp.]
MSDIQITRVWCKGCGICTGFCPKKVLALDSENKVIAAKPSLCVACRFCETHCPDFAISIGGDVK